jgi:hypothetical protein
VGGMLTVLVNNKRELSMNSKAIKLTIATLVILGSGGILLSNLLAKPQQPIDLTIVEAVDATSSKTADSRYLQLKPKDTMTVKVVTDKPTSKILVSNVSFEEQANEPLVSKAYVSAAGALDYDIAGNALHSANFSQLLQSLYDVADESSVLKQQQFVEMLNGVDQLANYGYEYGCGQGVCGVMVPYVAKDESKQLIDKLAGSIELGAFVQRIHTNEDGQTQVRMIFNQDTSAQGKTLTLSRLTGN